MSNDSKSEEIEVDCFQCGHTLTMSALKLESMNEMGQEVLCRECDDAGDLEDDGDIEFVPFF